MSLRRTLAVARKEFLHIQRDPRSLAMALAIPLVLLLLFLTFRNLAKLAFERKRGVLGSRLKTRLVLAFLDVRKDPVKGPIYEGVLRAAAGAYSEPLFVDAAGGDYHLSPTSTCIDAGENAAPALPLTDFEHQTRVAQAHHLG